MEKTYGHEIKLCRLNEERLFAPTFKPNIVLYNNLYNRDCREYAKYLKSCGVKIAILPTEGITFSQDQTTLFSHADLDIKFIDAYFCWNRIMEEMLTKLNVLSKSQIKKVGSLRFDFYTSRLRPLLKDKEYFQEKYGLEKGRKNIFLATNFANAEFCQNLDFLTKELKTQKATTLVSYEDPKALAEYEYRYRETVFDTLEQIAKNNTNINLLIKQHPSESEQTYSNLIERLNQYDANAVLIKAEYIWDVLNISDVVIQRCSTVAIEAWLFGKPTIELEYFNAAKHFLRPIYKDGSFIAKRPEDCVSILRDYMDQAELRIDANLANARDRLLADVLEDPKGETGPILAREINRVIEGSSFPTKIKFENLQTAAKALARTLFGQKGYVILTNLYKGRLKDYLGRFDKNYSKFDEETWLENIRELMAENY